MKKDNPHDEVEFLASGLQFGESRRFVCPKCGGGSTKEKAFSVSKSESGRIFYTCFRASCSWRGTLVSGDYIGEGIKLPFTKRLRKFDRPIENLDYNQIKWYREKYGVSPDNSVFYCPSKDMYAFKVFGPDGQLRGWQLKSPNDSAVIKNDNYVERDEPFISWYFSNAPEIGGVVIVEDIASARKVASCGISSVALLGTSIDYERAYEIGRHAENFVILALDRGTMQKAIEYRQRYEPVWGSVEIWQLLEDLKYVGRKRIKEALYDGKSDFVSLRN